MGYGSFGSSFGYGGAGFVRYRTGGSGGYGGDNDDNDEPTDWVAISIWVIIFLIIFVAGCN